MTLVDIAVRAGRSLLALLRLLVLFALPAVTMAGGCVYCGRQLTRLDREAVAAQQQAQDGGVDARLSARYSAER